MNTTVRILPVADYAQRADNVYLVTEQWPVGLSRRSLDKHHWLPRLAPSEGLLGWLQRDPARWSDFCASYWADLAANPARWQALTEAAERYGDLVLLHDYADTQINPVPALQQFIEARLAAAALQSSACERASPVCYREVPHR